jgi:hypothetical protein
MLPHLVPGYVTVGGLRKPPAINLSHVERPEIETPVMFAITPVVVVTILKPTLHGTFFVLESNASRVFDAPRRAILLTDIREFLHIVSIDAPALAAIKARKGTCICVRTIICETAARFEPTAVGF